MRESGVASALEICCQRCRHAGNSGGLQWNNRARSCPIADDRSARSNSGREWVALVPSAAGRRGPWGHRAAGRSWAGEGRGWPRQPRLRDRRTRGDPDTLLIVEQRGVVRRVFRGRLRGGAFLNIRDKVLSGGEQGLLSLAFSPG